MSSKEENPSLTGYYSMEKFIKELKKISGIPDSLILDEFQSNMPLHTSGDANTNNPYMSPYLKNTYNKLEIKDLSLITYP